MKTTKKMKTTEKMQTTYKMKTSPKMEICNNVGGISYYLKKLLVTPCLDCHSTTDLTPEMISAVYTGNRI
jgi:hypothetical protein